MKFQDIKVGDPVIVEERIVIGFHQTKTFYVRKLVTRRTKAQFCVDQKRYNLRGARIGEFFDRAHLEGDSYMGNPIKDQTKEMKQFEVKVELWKTVKGKVRDLPLTVDIDRSVNELKEIGELCDQLSAILRRGEDHG